MRMTSLFNAQLPLLLAAAASWVASAAGQACRTVDIKADETSIGLTGSCSELLALGYSCEDLACYARPVDLGSNVGAAPLQCGVQNPAGYAGQCSFTCGQNMYDGVMGEGACAATIRTHPAKCATDFGAGGSLAGYCDFACGFCRGAAAHVALPPPPPPRATCATSDLMDTTTSPGSCSSQMAAHLVSCEAADSLGVSPCNLACQHNILERPVAYIPATSLEGLAGLFEPLFPALGVTSAAEFVPLMQPGISPTILGFSMR